MKKLALAATLALACSSANAGVVSAAGGVYWDALAGQPNFESTVDYTQWWTTTNTATGQDTGAGVNSAVDANAVTPSMTNLTSLLGDRPELVGIGEFLMNTGNGGNPSCSGCELTFSFGGIFLEDITMEDTVFGPRLTPQINADAAWLNIYLDYDNAGEFDVSAAATANAATIATEVGQATNGTLWLSTMLEEFSYTPDFGALFYDQALAAGSSQFLVDVTGGIAQNNFLPFFNLMYEANTRGLSSSFSEGNDPTFSTQKLYALTGDGTVQAATISAPSTLAFMGLGLFGLAFAARRRNK
ncbi:PEP-CTERM sorting domain-containing protein [Brumicola nitratireducens]|uniref:PEP-CTERM protein-sorting domain-containing protein n=1 Tax=Glaciecola nitratireducens (strain JCM 12485 / KCTC 12276 / FR1064) TaxID=1085623 RepID=G4QM53_GLANF|nr:PEP-CTERM sorting domain-containing protein [Glaciecola nitratireducens]AEP30624.1 hypothetical protein GNIT_2527 [Glaciecola nitratireducens FR1064]